METITMPSTKKVYISCDGGFGNRLNCLISGLLICKVGKFEPIILWDANTWCGAKFNHIFQNQFEIIESPYTYFLRDMNSYQYILHRKFIKQDISNRHPSSFKSVNEIVEYFNSSQKEKLFYTHDSIEQYIFTSQVISVLRELNFSEKLVNKANQFITENNLGNDFYGVHLRSTDFSDSSRMNFEKVYENIQKETHKKFFVCSDDQELEEKFNKFKNVFIYKKTRYVEKLINDKEWSNYFTTSNGEFYSFYNVNRSEESVLEAIVDLLILSKSNIIKTSTSSFLNIALYLSQTYKN